jgi:hypothetical protein
VQTFINVKKKSSHLSRRGSIGRRYFKPHLEMIWLWSPWSPSVHKLGMHIRTQLRTNAYPQNTGEQRHPRPALAVDPVPRPTQVLLSVWWEVLAYGDISIRKWKIKIVWLNSSMQNLDLPEFIQTNNKCLICARLCMFPGCVEDATVSFEVSKQQKPTNNCHK